MNKYLTVLIVALVLIGLIVYIRRPVTTSKLPENTTEKSQGLPSGWAQINDKNNDAKYEKTVTAGVKPEVVKKTYTTKDAADPAKYVDKLIAGARSAIPSLKFDTDNRATSDGTYTALLHGTYQNGKQKIDVRQRIIIKGESVTVLTASYQGQLDNDVENIFDYLLKS